MTRKSIELAVVDFNHAIGMLVRRARVAASSDEISWSEVAVLNRLAKHGPSTTADLARAQGMRPQSMRTIVATLEESGWIERRPHATDGRQVELHLTPKGSAMHKRAGDAKRTWLAQVISSLNEHDQETLFHAGAIIKRLVEEDRF